MLQKEIRHLERCLRLDLPLPEEKTFWEKFLDLIGGVGPRANDRSLDLLARNDFVVVLRFMGRLTESEARSPIGSDVIYLGRSTEWCGNFETTLVKYSLRNRGQGFAKALEQLEDTLELYNLKAC